MNKSALLFLMLTVTLSGAATFAAPINEQKVAIPTVTRLVQIFSVLEYDLGDHAQKGNAEGIDQLLADDFEMRVGAMPGNPVPRAQWLRQFSKRAGSTFDIQQMAVHDYDSVAVVSFLLKQGKTIKSSGDIYIVDVWKKSDNTWKLAVRYASPAGNTRFLIPGAATDIPHIDKRY